MKKTLFMIGALLISFTKFAGAQELPKQNVISTAVPFLMIPPDARSGGMADIGAATTPDAYAQHWNPSKYAFMEDKQGFSMNYTPWMNSLVPDIFLGYVSYYNRLSERSALSFGFRYFSLGEIEKNELQGGNVVPVGTFNPNELSLDGAYSLKLSDHFSLGVALRYIYSNISDRTTPDAQDTKPGHGFGADISGFYQSPTYKFKDFDGRWRFGFNMSNIGPTISYNTASTQQQNKIPTNLRLGAGWDFDFDQYNTLSLQVETNKLLVPTPVANEAGDGYVIPDYGVMEGIFKSFYEAPRGFGEKISEFTFQAAAEYTYNDLFMLRGGWLYEDPNKGARQYATLGFGLKYNMLGLDFSYLIPTGNVTVKNPLENTLRISLVFSFGEGEMVDTFIGEDE